MKTLLLSLTLSIAIHAQGIIPNNTFVNVDYNEVPLLDVVSVGHKIKFVPQSPTNVAYYSGYITLKAVAEGNLCGTDLATVGTLKAREGNAIVSKIIAGKKWTNGISGCPQFSSPANILIPISVSMLPDFGNKGIDQVITYVRYTYQNKLARIVLKARGSQIQVNLVKQ